MTPSKYQLAIFDHVRRQWEARRRVRDARGAAGPRPRNLVIEATAGSGKTSTLRMLCNELPDARIDVVAFNDRVARDAARVLPSNAQSLTLHAAGKRALERFLGRRFRKAEEMREGDGELAPNKVDRIVARLKESGEVDRYVPARLVCRLVAAAKAAGLAPRGSAVGRAQPQRFTGTMADTDEAWQALMAQAGVEHREPGRLVAGARAALRLSVESSTAIIDFADMVYVPAHLPDLQFQPRDVVMVDELQDLDPVQRRMVVRMVRGCPRCAGEDTPVGDWHRSPQGVPCHAAERRPWGDNGWEQCTKCGQAMPAGFAKSGWRPEEVCARWCGGERRDAADALFVGVGDPMQAIYQWRGADSDSMTRVVEELDCDVLPLSVTYRCPTSHVAVAQALCPTIEAAPGAAPGEIRVHGAIVLPELATAQAGSPDAKWRFAVDGLVAEFADPVTWSTKPPAPADFLPGDAVLCRTNAPLVQVAYWLMRARVPVRVLGRDFGRGLSALLHACGQTVDQAIGVLEQKLRRSEARDRGDRTLEGAASDATTRLRDQLDVAREVIESLLDQRGCAACGGSGFSGQGTGYGDVCADCGGQSARATAPTLDDVCGEVERLFGDEAGADVVTLSSIHRAKGGEWERVWWADPEDCRPSKRTSDAEVRNLRFVALTRSKGWLGLFRTRDLK